MKVIVTGGTGFVGSAVVAQCIKDKRISEVVVLVRRGIDKALRENEKVKVIIHKDFAKYPPETIEQLQGAEGCIWCLGGKISDFGGKVQTARMVNVVYTMAAAKAFIEHLQPELEQDKNFSFVFCSGKGAEQDTMKKLWVAKDSRLIKGEAEHGLLGLAKVHSNFDATIMRPGGILQGQSVVPLLSKSLFIKRSDFAEALVEACIHPPSKKILENEEIRQAVVERRPRNA